MCTGASEDRDIFDWTLESASPVARQIYVEQNEQVIVSNCFSVGRLFQESYGFNPGKRYPPFLKSGDRIGKTNVYANGDVKATEYSDVNSFIFSGNGAIFTDFSTFPRIYARIVYDNLGFRSSVLSDIVLKNYPSTSTAQYALGFAFNNRDIVITPVYVLYGGSKFYTIYYSRFDPITRNFVKTNTDFYIKSNLAETWDGTTPLHTKMCWTGKHFVVIRTSPTLATAARIYMHTSTDGANWTTKDRFVDFAFGGTAFIPTIAKSVSGKDDKILISFTDAFDPRAFNSKIVYSTDAGNTFAVHNQPGPVSIPEVDPSPGYFTANSSVWDDKYSKFLLAGTINFPTKKVAAVTAFDGTKFDKVTIIADSKVTPTTAFLTEAYAINYTSNKYYVGGLGGVFSSPR